MGSAGIVRRGAPSLLGLAALIWAAALVPPAGAAPPRPSVEIVGESAEGAAEALTVPTEGGEAGELELPLLVRRPGRLAVTWVDGASGEAFRLGVDRRAPAPLRGRLPKARLAAGDVQLLRLRFTMPEAASGAEEAAPLGGVLSIRTGAGMPLTRRVSAADGDAQTVTPAQEKVTISTTRFLPLVTDPPSEEREVGMIVEGGAAAAPAGAETVAAETGAETGEGDGTDPLGESYLALNDSGNATVTVGAPGGEGPVRRSTVTVSDTTGVGTGTTKIALGGGEDAEKLEVEVKVGDGLLGPLLAILLGLLFGGYLPAFAGLRRQGGKLADELEQAVKSYEQALDEEPPVELGLGGIQGTVESAAALRHRLDRVLKPSTLRVEAERAAELIDTIEGWVAVREALVELARSVAVGLPEELADELSSPQLSRPLDDSRELLVRELEIDADLEAAKEIARAVRHQAAALRLILSIYRLATGAVATGRAEGDTLAAMEEAVQAYLEAKPPLLRSDEEAEAMIEALRRVHFALERRLAAAEPEVARLAVAGMGPLGIDGLVGNLVSRLIGNLLDAAEPSEAPSAEQVMSRVPAASLLLGGLAFLISALGVLLPLYADGPFGTLHDYLGVFVAGAGIQVAVNLAAPLAKPRSAKRAEEPPPAPLAHG